MPTNCQTIPIANLFAGAPAVCQLATSVCEARYFIFNKRTESIILGNSERDVPVRSQLTAIAESGDYIGQTAGTVTRAMLHAHTTLEEVETNT